MTQLQISGAAVEFGATLVFRDITFTVAARERWGIIGRNGTGKTTLFKLITGELQPTRGSVTRQGGLRISLLEQQKKAYQDLIGRRGMVADRLESSALAMQNMRYDLVRLKASGVGAVINTLSMATQQARALSRDVDHAIAAASDI